MAIERLGLRVAILATSSILLLSVLACSDGGRTDDSANTTVPTVEAYGGAVRLYVDPGALPEGMAPDAITMTELTAADLPDLDGPLPQIALRIGPSGTVFEEPLTVAIELEFDPDSGEVPSFTLASGEGGADLDVLPVTSLLAVGDPSTSSRFVVTLELPHLSELYGQVTVANGVRAAIVEPIESEFPIGQPFTVTTEARVVGDDQFTQPGLARVHPIGNRPARISGNIYVTAGAVRRVPDSDAARPDHTRSVLPQALRGLVDGVGRQSSETTLLAYNHVEVPLGEARRHTIGLECERTGPFVVIFAAQFDRPATVQTLGRGSTIRAEKTLDWPQGAIARFVGLCVGAPSTVTETPAITASVAANVVPDGTYEVAATWSEGSGGCGFPAGFEDDLVIEVSGTSITITQPSASDQNTGTIGPDGTFEVSQASPPEDYSGQMNADGSGTGVNHYTSNDCVTTYQVEWQRK